jgi:hypothetical protein
MAVKSIIDVDLKDDKFKAYLKIFNRYQAQLAQQPALLGQGNVKLTAAQKIMNAIIASQAAQAKLIAQMVVGQKAAVTAASQTSTYWQSIARNTQTVASNIKSATSSLLKWTALTSVFTGLLGAGGLFGIDRLAGNVASGRQQSKGLGVTYGEKKAFDINFGRFVETESFLSNINEALTDVTKRHALYGSGLLEKDIAGKNPAQVGEALLASIKRLADQTPKDQLGNVLHGVGLDQIITLREAMKLKETLPSELATQRSRYSQDKGALGLDEEIQRKWQELSTQLGRAAQEIENTFVKGLGKIVPGLDALSVSAEKVVSAFFKSKTIGDWLEKVDTGLETFAKYIGTDEFKTNVEAFVAGLGKMAEAIGKVVKWFAPGEPGGAAEIAPGPVGGKIVDFDALGLPGLNGLGNFLLNPGGESDPRREGLRRDLPAEFSAVNAAQRGTDADRRALFNAGADRWMAGGDQPSNIRVINKSNADVTVTVSSPAGSNVINTGAQVAQ